MIPKIAFVAAALGVVAFALFHPAHAPIAQSAAATALPEPAPPDSSPRRHLPRTASTGDDLVVYVAGAVKNPGLYHLREGERAAAAVARAGGFNAAADASAVNLAQRAADGDEIFVPAAGVSPRQTAHARRGHRRHAAPAAGSIDVNRSSAAELGSVPGIGHALAQRIVELRRREGSFATLDELLDVAGMTQSRLERARPYLRQP